LPIAALFIRLFDRAAAVSIPCVRDNVSDARFSLRLESSGVLVRVVRLRLGVGSRDGGDRQRARSTFGGRRGNLNAPSSSSPTPRAAAWVLFAGVLEYLCQPARDARSARRRVGLLSFPYSVACRPGVARRHADLAREKALAVHRLDDGVCVRARTGHRHDDGRRAVRHRRVRSPYVWRGCHP